MTDAPLIPPVLDPILLLQTQLASINSRIASGVKDMRLKDRSTTFDLGVLQSERDRVEAQLRSLGVGLTAGAPVVRNTRRLLMVQFSKGL